MKKRIIPVMITALLLIAATHVSAQVTETDDIDSFINDDSQKKTTQQKQSTVSQSGNQDVQVKHKVFSLGIGFNFGFFTSRDITDINSHMYAKVLAENTDVFISEEVSRSDTKIYLNMVPRFTINIMPIRYLMIQILGEVGWGPKIVMVLSGTSHTFQYMRYSPGLILNAYIPLGAAKKYSLFFGGGALYHFLEFEGYEAQAFGGRGQFGLRIDWTSIGLEIFAAYDYARGETGEFNPYIGRDMTLDYSSFLIGLNLYFKII